MVCWVMAGQRDTKQQKIMRKFEVATGIPEQFKYTVCVDSPSTTLFCLMIQWLMIRLMTFSQQHIVDFQNLLYWTIYGGALPFTLDHIVTELFQLQMRISFPFLRAKDLCRSLLIMRARGFSTLLYVGRTLAKLVYTWYKMLI